MTSPRAIEEIIAALDADVIAAKTDVDFTLLQASLRRSPEERLDSACRVLRDLVRISEQHAAVARLLISTACSRDCWKLEWSGVAARRRSSTAHAWSKNRTDCGFPTNR